jgi:hypothetical protein
MLSPVIAVLVEMLECANDTVVMRCMETLRKFCRYAHQHSEIGEQVTALLLECDLKGQLDELLRHEPSMLTEQAELLLTDYKALGGN